jgi:hypothetical protein
VPLFLEDGSLPAREIDAQVEKDYNKLLDDCNDFRDNLGELSDNISLGVSMQQFWENRCAEHAEASISGIGELQRMPSEQNEVFLLVADTDHL